MATPGDTAVDVRSLLDRPGATMSLRRSIAVPADLSDELVALGPTVSVDAIVERVVDGLLVRGAVTTPVTLSCARCLATRVDEIHADVVELFSATGDDDEPGYEIVDATIDLDALLRDALAAATPVRPLCRPDCPGLCPTCGADLAVAPCGGHDDRHDPRWAALSRLQLPDAD